jgi:C-terminal processing protease CtpA/Prc
MGRPLLGVQLVEVTDELREHLGGRDGEGVLVSKVVSGSPAEDAGIRVGDLIVGLDGDDVGSVGDLRQGLSGKQGETFDVDVIRDGRPESVRVTIPARESGAPSGPRAFYLAPQGFDELRQMLHDTRLQSREAIRQAGKASQDAARLYREAPRGADLRNSI